MSLGFKYVAKEPVAKLNHRVVVVVVVVDVRVFSCYYNDCVPFGHFQDTLSMSESCFVLTKDFSSLIILTRSLSNSNSSSSSSSSSTMTASAYEKFKSDVNYCVNLCVDTLHESKIDWTPLPLSKRRSNVLRLSELESLIV